MGTELLYMMKSEWLLTIIIFILFFSKLSGNAARPERLLNFINGLLLVNLIAGFFFIPTGHLFGNMYRTSELITFEKNLLNAGTLIISMQSWHWLRHHKHIHEFYVLLLSTLLGMFLMVSSGNLLMFYLGLELSTIPLAALCNFGLGVRRSSEAALKMIISSAFSSGLLLFGISWLYGATGTLDFAAMTGRISGEPFQLFAFVLLLAGVGFKISAVPFHLWTADVYEGSPIAVTAYLSVISKGAMLFVMITLLYDVFAPLADTWYRMISIIAVATMLIGNLFALRQENMKRFLAFSSIAQMGFILVGLGGQSVTGSTSVIYFVLVYLFSNLGAFGVVALVSSLTGRESMSDYTGFHKTNPRLAWVLAISLFSLAGIPPMAGFFGKFFLIFVGAAKGNWALVVIAALNMVIALYYYLKIIRTMFMETSDRPLERIQSHWQPRLALILCLAGILVSGVASGAYNYIHSMLASLH
jgi:NADH-quinone oxidoreductase subunit N